MPIRFDLTRFAKETDVFIETGTLMGEGIACALAAGWNRIVSIELSDEHKKRVDFMFGGMVELGKLEVIYEDCLQALPRVIESIGDNRATFWLDAHHEVTLYPSLDIIAKARRNDHVIMVDDLRIMGKEAPSVSIDELGRRLLSINDGYRLQRVMGCCPEDVMIASI